MATYELKPSSDGSLGLLSDYLGGLTPDTDEGHRFATLFDSYFGGGDGERVPDELVSMCVTEKDAPPPRIQTAKLDSWMEEEESTEKAPPPGVRDQLYLLFEEIQQTGDVMGYALEKSGFMPYRHISARGAGRVRFYAEDEDGLRVEVYIRTCDLSNPDYPHVWLTRLINYEDPSEYVKLIDYDAKRFDHSVNAREQDQASFASIMSYTFYLDGTELLTPILSCPYSRNENNPCDCTDPLSSEDYSICGVITDDDFKAAIHPSYPLDGVHLDPSSARKAPTPLPDSKPGIKTRKARVVSDIFSKRSKLPRCYKDKDIYYPPFILTMALFSNFCHRVDQTSNMVKDRGENYSFYCPMCDVHCNDKEKHRKNAKHVRLRALKSQPECINRIGEDLAGTCNGACDHQHPCCNRIKGYVLPPKSNGNRSHRPSARPPIGFKSNKKKNNAHRATTTYVQSDHVSAELVDPIVDDDTGLQYPINPDDRELLNIDDHYGHMTDSTSFNPA